MTRCTRCRTGSALRTHTEDGPADQCLACGHTEPLTPLVPLPLVHGGGEAGHAGRTTGERVGVGP